MPVDGVGPKAVPGRRRHQRLRNEQNSGEEALHIAPFCGVSANAGGLLGFRGSSEGMICS